MIWKKLLVHNSNENEAKAGFIHANSIHIVNRLNDSVYEQEEYVDHKHETEEKVKLIFETYNMVCLVGQV